MFLINCLGLITKLPFTNVVLLCEVNFLDVRAHCSYDEDYNRRPREDAGKLPVLRKWNSNTMSWVPEKSDYPLQGLPSVKMC